MQRWMDRWIGKRRGLLLCFEFSLVRESWNAGSALSSSLYLFLSHVEKETLDREYDIMFKKMVYD